MRSEGGSEEERRGEERSAAERRRAAEGRSAVEGRSAAEGRNIKMTIGGGNPKRSNLKHSKDSLKKLYKSRLTYKKSWRKSIFCMF